MYGGSEFYGADVMMQEENMILVTINYRLGILGFLSTEDEVIPGNLGLKDQVEALRWVQRNIKAFNGDPEKVTIAGFSAGGASVQLHYLSQLSNGLFNNGISHSGVALNPWVMMENARDKAFQVGALMGCDHRKKQDSKKLLKCLKTVPTEKLVMAAKHFQPFLYNPFSPFGVVVEKHNQHPFLTDHPKNILKRQKYQRRPYISSMTKDEGLYPAAEFYKNETVKAIDENWVKLAPFLLDYDSTTSDEKLKVAWAKEIREFYFGDEKISLENFGKLTKVSEISRNY
jgi:carboxylesterase type B